MLLIKETIFLTIILTEIFYPVGTIGCIIDKIKREMFAV